MANNNYDSRKEQIEKEFLRDLKRKLKQEGIGYFTRAQTNVMKKALRDAAMVGACEERNRALELIRRNPITAETAITVVPVLKVLGYDARDPAVNVAKLRREMMTKRELWARALTVL